MRRTPLLIALTAAAAFGGFAATAMNELLERSDFVSLHCPRDESTLRMMDAKALRARCRIGAS